MKSSLGLHNPSNVPVIPHERAVQELVDRLDSLEDQLRHSKSSSQKYRSKCHQLETQLEEMTRQLYQEQKECKARHLHHSKYKVRSERYKLRIAELESEILHLNTQNFHPSMLKDSQDPRINETGQTRHLVHHNAQVIRLDQQLKQSRELNLDLKEQLKEYHSRLEDSQSKLQAMDSQKQNLMSVNQSTFLDVQDNLEKILSKVKLLEKENEDLRVIHLQTCDQLKTREYELYDLRLRKSPHRNRPPRSNRSDASSSDSEYQS